MGFARLRNVALECADPKALANFYRELTGWQVVNDEPDWVTLGDGGEIRLAFQEAPGHKPPTWPDDSSSMQIHLDFMVEDLKTAGDRAMALGATRFDHQPGGDDFVVYADPAGHPFCLCV
jgi:catechol 2,3-dioxygenase-like lactoylglutathione lyase family enzyme